MNEEGTQEMTGNSLLRRAKKVKCRGGFNSRNGFNRILETPSSLIQLHSHDETACSGSQQAAQHLIHISSQKAIQSTNGIWLIDKDGTLIRHSRCTTCRDIKCLPSGTRIHIEVDDVGIPCNIPESILLGSFLGVVARDAMLAPINFPDWRNKGMELFKKKMLAEVESKFDIPGHIRLWILQSIRVKWRNHKTTLKAKYFDSRPLEEIMEAVPEGVESSQWCQLVTQWTQPLDQKKAAKNNVNNIKQTSPHTMGQISSIQKKCEMALLDRLLQWRINQLHKDGSWSSENARQKWILACKLLSAEGLSPEDGNMEANERVFLLVMGHERPGRVRAQGFGVTPT